MTPSLPGQEEPSQPARRPEPVLFETHMHTPLCRHARGLPGEYARAAWQRGLRGIIVTCHCPMPGGYSAGVRMAPSQFPEYLAMIEAAAAAWAGRVEVLAGLESDYIPGCESWLEELHARAPLHYVLGSVHPFVPEYKERYFAGDIRAYQELYFEHLALAAETGLFDALAHPDLIKNEDPGCWDVEAILPCVRRCLDRIAATGCAMELNTSGALKKLPEMNPGPQILREMAARGIPVVIGADAHVPERVGDRFPEALDALEAAGFCSVSLFRARQRFEVPIALARRSLEARAG
ncbi:MAG: histidinol-phosphatase [Terrimicrobiaceae bacterium]|nr:histidinol-phosphatase [Terrimicrobiaceae bacterium]